LIKLKKVRLNANLITTPFLAMGAIFALLLLILGIVGYFVTAPAPIGAWNHSWLTPTQDAADSLEQKLDVLKLEVDLATPGELLTLTITEQEATSKLHFVCMEGNITVSMRDPQIYFADGLFRGFAEVDLLIDIQMALETELAVKDGKLDAVPKNLHMGKIPIPRAMVDSIATALEKEMDERWDSLSVSLYDISIGDGVMLVTLQKK